MSSHDHGPSHAHTSSETVPKPFGSARHERTPAPSPEDIEIAERELRAELELARKEGHPLRVSPEYQRVLDHAAADDVRARIQAEFFAEAAHAEGGHDAHHKSHGEGHGDHSHGAHGGHGHAKQLPKSGGVAKRLAGDARGTALTTGLAVGEAGKKGVWWVVSTPYRWLKALGDAWAPDGLKAMFGEKAEGGAKKKKKADHGHGGGHGHDDHGHGGGHH